MTNVPMTSKRPPYGTLSTRRYVICPHLRGVPYVLVKYTTYTIVWRLCSSKLRDVRGQWRVVCQELHQNARDASKD